MKITAAADSLLSVTTSVQPPTPQAFPKPPLPPPGIPGSGAVLKKTRKTLDQIVFYERFGGIKNSG